MPGLAAILVCCLLGYVFGLGGATLWIFVLVLWFPITAFFFGVLHLTYNPKLQEYHSDSLDLNPRM